MPVRARRPVLFALAALSLTSLAHGQDAPAAPKQIVLTVVDAETRKPIPGASVWARVDPGGSSPLQRVDEAGKLTVPMRGAAPKYVSLLAAADGYGMMRVTWNGYNKPLDMPEAYELALPRGGPIGGVVTDADGQPIPEAHLTLTIEMGDLPPNVTCGASWRQITADENGRWSFPNAPGVWKRVQLGAYDLERGGNERGFYSIDTLPPGDAEKLRTKAHELRLPPARQIIGRVTDADGKPVRGATVTLGEGRGSNAIPAAKVDADGLYVIGVKPDAEVTLTIAAKGFAPELLRVTNTAELGPVDQVMQPAKQVTGRVVGPDGGGVPNARISIDSWRGSRSLARQLTTDGEGRFTWNDAPADAVVVSATAPGFAYSRDVTIAPGQPNLITLQKPVVFRGKVVDAETKQPIAGVATDIGIVFSKDQPPHFRSSDGSERPTSAADGTFQIEFDIPYDGRIVRVEKDGYARADSPMVTMDGGDHTFTFEMRRAAGLAGSVVDPAGKPAAGVTVLLATPGNPVQLVNGESPERGGRDVLSRTTDAAGKFTFPAEDGDFALVASGPAGYARIDKAALKADQAITLNAWARVEGDVFIGSKPAAGAKVQAWFADRYDQNAPRIHSSLSATADAAGHFLIERVPPGEWQLGRYTQVGEQAWTIASAVKVDAKPGDTQTVRIGGKGRPVVGRVEVPAELEGKADWFFYGMQLTGKAAEMPPMPKTPQEMQAMSEVDRKAFIESPEFKAWQEKQRAAHADTRRFPGWIKPDGTYRIDDVEPGTYTLTGQIFQRPPNEPRSFGKPIGQLVQADVTIPAGDLDEPVEVPVVAAKVN